MSLCKCGCGLDAGVYARTRPDRGHLAGEPRAFLPLHSTFAPRKIFEPGEEYIVEDRGFKSPCWIWQGCISSRGYAKITENGQGVYTHRSNYLKKHGSIPEGFEIDHLCRVRECVNPDHLEAVPHIVNSRRGAHTKLTWGAVRRIRWLAGTTTLNQGAIGELVGISSSVVSRVVRGQVWRESHYDPSRL